MRCGRIGSLESDISRPQTIRGGEPLTETVGIQTPEELAAYFEQFGQVALFRGQAKEYLTQDKRSLITTSFMRNGCVPPLMLKWSHYAEAILRTHAKGFDDRDDLATAQAILQHYGWRSFFVDATASPLVASWFASHSF
jgi:hypothetical protein